MQSLRLYILASVPAEKTFENICLCQFLTSHLICQKKKRDGRNKLNFNKVGANLHFLLQTWIAQRKKKVLDKFVARI